MSDSLMVAILLIKSQFIVNLLGSFNSFSYLCTEITIYW